jgi:glycosyltransferase involved in cell wall biosynthesis
VTTLPVLPKVPRVSVYTCVYNHERFVAEAIESVLSQGWPEDRLEYVVIDDGSTDGSPDAVRPYLDRIVYVRQENRGIRGTVNRVLGMLTGDVVVSVAGDDAWPAGRLERLVEFLREHPAAGMAYSDLEVIDDAGRTISPSFMRTSGLVGHRGRIRGRLIQANCVSGGGCIVRGDLFGAFHPIPDHASWEDWWWAWQLAGIADVEFLDEPTYRYRQHDANVSLGATGERLAWALGEDLRFRRWMLRTVTPEDASPHELASGIVCFDHVLGAWERETGVARAELVPVSAADRRAADRHVAAAHEALRVGNAPAALFETARGLGRDPLASAPRELVTTIVPAVAAHVLVPASPAPAAAPGFQLDARSFVVVADADELAADAALLRAYGEAFGDADDATLVIHADWPAARVAAELPALVAAAGLDGPAAPDLLAVSADEAPREVVLARADALLGSAGADGAAAPAFSAADIEALAWLVARTARRAA